MGKDHFKILIYNLENAVIHGAKYCEHCLKEIHGARFYNKKIKVEKGEYYLYLHNSCFVVFDERDGFIENILE